MRLSEWTCWLFCSYLARSTTKSDCILFKSVKTKHFTFRSGHRGCINWLQRKKGLLLCCCWKEEASWKKVIRQKSVLCSNIFCVLFVWFLPPFFLSFFLFFLTTGFRWMSKNGFSLNRQFLSTFILQYLKWNTDIHERLQFSLKMIRGKRKEKQIDLGIVFLGWITIVTHSDVESPFVCRPHLYALSTINAQRMAVRRKRTTSSVQKIWDCRQQTRSTWKQTERGGG